MSLDVHYPDISEALHSASSLDEAWIGYIDMLRDTEDIINAQYATKLEQSHNMLSASNLKQLEKDFVGFKDHLRNCSKQTGIHLHLLRRQKAFIGLNEKIRLFINSGKNLSKINDLLGFRIVIQTPYPDTEDSIKYCYNVLNEVLFYFCLKKEYLILEAEPRVGLELMPQLDEKLGILVPPQGYIYPGFQINVKDYICNPKSNGYQSLHIEVQIRTFAMDILAEHGSGVHIKYKIEKYENVELENIDYSKIKMPGFMQLSNGEVYDTIGLTRSIDPFNHLR